MSGFPLESKRILAPELLVPGEKPASPLLPRGTEAPLYLYQMDGVARDLVSANDLALTNTTWGADYLSFDGSTSSSSTSSAIKVSGADQLVVVMQLRYQAFDGTELWYESSSSWSSNPGAIICYLDTGYMLNFGYKVATTFNYRKFDISGLTVGEWYTFVCIFDQRGSGDQRLFINGKSYSGTPVTSATPTGFTDHTLYIGARNNSSIYSELDLKLFALLDYSPGDGACRNISVDPYNAFFRPAFPDYIPVGAVSGAAGAIMNQFQGPNLGSDLFNGTFS